MNLKNTINYKLKSIEKKHKGFGVFKNNMREYELKNSRDEFRIEKDYLFPILTDRFEQAGTLGAYFWQDLWAAKLIYGKMPKKHYDIGSRVDGFIGHLSTFHDDIVLVDVRPLEQKIPGVSFIQADATRLSNIKDESIDSISALCSLEHFGLGRYGDEINPEACFEAFESIQRVTNRGGYIYISVPVGHEHLEFDAHRIFRASTIVDEFSKCELIEFSCVHENDDGIEKNVDIHKYDKEKNRGKRFGLFHFVKL